MEEGSPGPSQSIQSAAASQGELVGRVGAKEEVKVEDENLTQNDILVKQETHPDTDEDHVHLGKVEAEDLLVQLREGNLGQLASTMQNAIGLSFGGLVPKTAVLRFYERYTASDRIEWSYVHHQWDLGFSATLTLPAFYNRSFTGQIKRTTGQAEISAAQVFLKDSDVLEAAPRLPPSQKYIRKHVPLKKYQRLALFQMGLDPEDVHKQVLHQVYMGFRALGCRTEVWDGNS